VPTGSAAGVATGESTLGAEDGTVVMTLTTSTVSPFTVKWGATSLNTVSAFVTGGNEVGSSDISGNDYTIISDIGASFTQTTYNLVVIEEDGDVTYYSEIIEVTVDSVI
jgi:hypothetical protein